MKTISKMKALTAAEMKAVMGGSDGGPGKDTSLAYDIFYYTGVIAHGIWDFAKSASEYQHSLPPSLKK
jgi:hypothetical protein